MPDPDPALAALDALGFALFAREDSGALRLVGDPPAWVRELWPTIHGGGAELSIGDASPFLENFLVDADACWKGVGGRAISGPWIERAPGGAEVSLEATALLSGGRRLLLIQRLGELFEAKKLVLQKARENVIAYQLLNAELLKKEILLHCIAENMTASLANAITAMRLIELESDPAKIRVLLNLASRALEDQQSMIHKVLDVYAADLDGFYGRIGQGTAGGGLHAIVRAAVQEVTPQFSDKGVRLAIPEFPGEVLPVAADDAHIQRVVANLLENALLATPAGGETALRIEDRGDSLIVRVEDNGVPAEGGVPTELFARVPSDTRPEPALLRLHFCRIAMENSGGEIGWKERAGGGNSFWIRVPKARHAS